MMRMIVMMMIMMMMIIDHPGKHVMPGQFCDGGDDADNDDGVDADNDELFCNFEHSQSCVR